ncbi:hypothetical protein L0F63_006313 [Massospora cicadina]|nr:hypothetical protein L0F63_006313 [Massospora cicadina]
MQLSIHQLLRVLARNNIDIGDVTQVIHVQQNDTHLLFDRLDHSFLEVQGALVHVDHRVVDIRHHLDVLVPQLNQELPQMIGELLDWHGLLVEWVWDVTTLGSNIKQFMMDLEEWVEVIKAEIAQIRDMVALTEQQITDHANEELVQE